MARGAFMARLEERIRAAADDELAQVGKTARDCPYLEVWLAFYRAKSAGHIERAIRRYTSETRPSVEGLSEAVEARVREAVVRWRQTGQLSGIPEQSPVLVPSTDAAGPPLLRARASDALPAPGNPAATAASLGPGRPLDAGVRTRMEQGFGGELGHVRVHADATGAALARRNDALAFSVGEHVAFAEGAYRPGSPAGDALLAHELAHVRQQARPDARAGTPDLERSATLAAVTSMRRLYGSNEPAPLAGPGAGLRLQRCKGGTTTQEVTAGDRQWNAPSLSPAAGARTPRADVPDLTSIPLAVGEGWSRIPDDHVLAVQSGDRLFLAPAHFFVSEGTEPMAARATPPDPSRRPIAGMPAVGHGSLTLFNVGGMGILFDAGGAGGQTRGILPGALAALKVSLGIDRIDGVLLLHTHADHVRQLVALIEAGQIQGNRVWIWPGWETATKGPWAKVLQQLRDPSMTARGFGPSWSPTPLAVQTIGATGRELTVGTMPLGNAELTMVTRTADLAAYVGELQSGSTGTRTADASSMLTRVRVPGAPDVLVVGNLRGHTIQQIADQMEAGGIRFVEWVSQVRMIIGFHHLGNVETATDTGGYSYLFRALPAGETVTIVAQANPAKVNVAFRNRLIAAGFRVVILPTADPAAVRQLTLSQSRQVLASGASVYEATGAVAETSARIARIRAASSVLRSRIISGSLMVTGDATAAQQLADALDAEARTLEQAVRDRRELELRGLEDETRPPDYATRAAASDTALRAQGPVETRVGAETLTQLARVQPRIGELVRLLEEVARTGTSRPELRALIEEVGPDVYREVLARNRIEDAAPGAARERAIRSSFAQLLRQRDLQRALQTGPGSVGMVGRGVLAFTALVELANAIGPYITRARDAANASEAQKMMSLVGAIGWWQRFGLNVPFWAATGGATLSPEAVGPAIARRLWEATPYQDRMPEKELPGAVKSAAPLESVDHPRGERVARRVLGAVRRAARDHRADLERVVQLDQRQSGRRDQGRGRSGHRPMAGAHRYPGVGWNEPDPVGDRGQAHPGHAVAARRRAPGHDGLAAGRAAGAAASQTVEGRRGARHGRPAAPASELRCEGLTRGVQPLWPP